MGLIGNRMPTDAHPHQAPSAKTRILRAAVLLFAHRPLSETSLRDIATAAHVDVAYVHRAFGSKAEIFRQALQFPAAADGDDPAPAPGALVERLCNLALSPDPQRVEEVEPLHLVLQSCACSEARAIVADFIEATIAKSLAESFGQRDIGRAMFAISLMSGFSIMRLVVGHPALRAMPQADLKDMLAKVLWAAMTP